MNAGKNDKETHSILLLTFVMVVATFCASEKLKKTIREDGLNNPTGLKYLHLSFHSESDSRVAVS